MTKQPVADDLAALGLPPTAARVLALLAAESWTTSVALAAQSGLSRASVSDAVDVLEEWGLVERTRGRRPAPLRLHRRVEGAVEARLQDLQRQLDERTRGAQRAAAWLREAAATSAARPAPVREITPGGAPEDTRLMQCRVSYDEVCRADSGTVLFGGTLAHRYMRRRVIVLGQPPAARGAHMLRRGVELRTTQERLPVLLIADALRARVEIAADGRSGRGGWTHDPAQVRALQQLFTLWWEQSQPWVEPAAA